jgi:hypothetical protein
LQPRYLSSERHSSPPLPSHHSLPRTSVPNCKHSFLTASSTDVFSFVRAPGALLINAQISRPRGDSRTLWAQGFTVKDSSDGWSILNGDIDGANSAGLEYYNRWSIVSRGSGAERMILDTNPYLLERFKLGRVERLSGTPSNQRQRIGQLIYPADYQPNKKYPVTRRFICINCGFRSQESRWCCRSGR